MKTTWRNQEKAKGKMEEKKYLKWYNKVGYGSGDMAGNVVYSFLSSFIMIYLTNRQDPGCFTHTLAVR